MSEPAVLLESVGLSKRFPVGRVRFFGAPRAELFAVDDVSFRIHTGESIGLVGESGCGKSTLVRVLARLLDPTEGSIVFAGGGAVGDGARDIGGVPARSFARHPSRGRIQMVFQDPTDSLNPRYSALDTIVESVRLLSGQSEFAAATARARELATAVGLPEELLARYPHQLSGGQKARVGIARALAADPQLLILDEPTSALDVSVQAVILKLLAKLKAERNLSYLFVSHDLNVVRLLCDRVIVMYCGRVVEVASAEALFRAPRHPYTRALISAIPVGMDRDSVAVERVRLSGEVTSPIDPSPTRCRFAPRCNQAQERCLVEMPLLGDVAPGHASACHFA